MSLIKLLLLLPLTTAAPHKCSYREGLNWLVSHSELIVSAEITEVENINVGLWSGTGETKQHVTYKVKSVLKGELNASTIKVGHHLYRNSLSVDRERPRLSTQLFRPGNTLLLFIKTGQIIS